MKKQAAALLLVLGGAVSVGAAGCGSGEAPNAVSPTGPRAQSEALWNAASDEAKASFCESERDRGGVVVQGEDGRPLNQPVQDAFDKVLRENC